MDADILANLKPDDIHKIARWYAAEAKRLHLIASEREAVAEREKQARIERQKWDLERARLGSIMAAFMADGMSRERAVKTLSRQIGTEKNILVYVLKSYLKDKNERARDSRRITAIRLAQNGWSNERIAAWIGCHPNTVSRDIRRALDPER